jgi:hypothetical protein
MDEEWLVPGVQETSTVNEATGAWISPIQHVVCDRSPSKQRRPQLLKYTDRYRAQNFQVLCSQYPISHYHFSLPARLLLKDTGIDCMSNSVHICTEGSQPLL